MKPYRVLVTGSREWTDCAFIYNALIGVTGEAGMRRMIVVHGACKRGADKCANRWVEAYDCGVERHPAEWERFGKAAGFVRNQVMVEGGADICLAFYKTGAGNRGTDDCAKRAQKAGIPVRRYWS